METIGIDCGANVGLVTASMLKSCDRIYAFEPNPYAFRELQSRFEDLPNVICYNKAVLDREDSVKLFFHENSDEDEVLWSTGSSLLNIKDNVCKNKFTKVQAVDLCSFIEDLNCNIKILKMDVEGVEYQIIHKLIDTNLIHKIEKLHVELHAKKIPELKDKEDKLKNRISNLNLKNINIDWI